MGPHGGYPRFYKYPEKRLQKKVLNKACMYIKIGLACVQGQESEKNLEFIFYPLVQVQNFCGKTLQQYKIEFYMCKLFPSYFFIIKLTTGK